MHTSDAGILSHVTQLWRQLQHHKLLKSFPTLKIPKKHLNVLGPGLPAAKYNFLLVSWVGWKGSLPCEHCPHGAVAPWCQDPSITPSQWSFANCSQPLLFAGLRGGVGDTSAPDTNEVPSAMVDVNTMPSKVFLILLGLLVSRT